MIDQNRSMLAPGSDIYQPTDKVLTGASKTVDYVVIPYGQLVVNYSNRPWFSLVQAEAMLWDQQVWFGLQLANAPLLHAKVEVSSPSSEVKMFVQEHWDRFWRHYATRCIQHKYFGYAGFEVGWCMKDDVLQIDSLRHFHPRDVGPLIQQGDQRERGRIAGISVRGQRQSSTSAIGTGPQAAQPLFGMNALWLTYDARYGSNFGRAITEKAYPAWWDKAMPGGAYDLRRLRGVKDAWIGDVVKYPLAHKLQLPDGTPLSGKDMMRELMENRASGGGLVIPSDCDPLSGKELFGYQPPTSLPDSELIRKWIEDLDWDIFDGILIPREVVEASSSGSGYSGRSVPMIMFFSLRDAEFRDIVTAYKQQLAEPQVERCLGASANDFEMRPIPLLDTFTEKIQGGQEGGQVGGTTQGKFDEQGDDREADLQRMDSNKGGMGATRQLPRAGSQQFSAEPPAGMHWVTLNHHAGDNGARVLIDGDGNIHAGPKALAGKNLNSLKSKSGKAASFDPSEWEKPKKAFKPKNRAEQEIHRTAEDYGLDVHDLIETVDHVHSERTRANDERELAKKAARQKTGLTQQDVERLSNAGHDYASAHKAGGATAEKMKHFDSYAQELAREQPELGLGDPDDPSEDFAANLWDILAEGRQATLPKHHPDIVREAADLLHRGNKHFFPDQLETVQFSSETPGSRAKNRLANQGAEDADDIYSHATLKLNALLKKNSAAS